MDQGTQCGGLPTQKQTSIKLVTNFQNKTFYFPGQGSSEPDDLIGTPAEEPVQFESESTGPVFDQLEGDQFGMQEVGDEDMEDSLATANGVQQQEDNSNDASQPGHPRKF